MATWKLTPDTGQITGSHSNMPLVVIPSLAGVGTITLAEAQSSRFYTDSGLVTEVPREVVSSDEIHHKPGTVDSALESYMDFDGVRADYATTATYGRNNVWSDYVLVDHGNGVDSTGNATSVSGNGGVVLGGATGKIGDASDFDGSDDYVDYGNNSAFATPVTNNAITLSVWASKDNISGTPQEYLLFKESNEYCLIHGFTSNLYEFFVRNNVVRFNIGTVATTDFTHIVATFDGSTNIGRGFVNATKTETTGLTGVLGYSVKGNFFAGAAHVVNQFAGVLDEIRVKASASTDDWITTEYNNQNDNAAFWVAEDVSGGGGWNGYPMIHILQFNCVM